MPRRNQARMNINSAISRGQRLAVGKVAEQYAGKLLRRKEKLVRQHVGYEFGWLVPSAIGALLT